jgi:hypothetical protein
MDGLAKRLWRDLCLVVAGVAGVIAAYIVVIHPAWFAWSPDWSVCMDAAQRWLATGAYFLPRQLSGPYQHLFGDVLYPPTALYLFVPFSFLPRLAWFVVPLAVIVAALWRLRPAAWGWAAMGILFCYDPVAIMELTSGNPLLWVLAALFASVAFGTPASFVLLKPTLLPFALFGIWRRSWWLGLALLVVLSLPMLALDLTWLRVVLDTQDPMGPFTALHEMPCAAVPLAAWLASARSAEMRRAVQARVGGRGRRVAPVEASLHDQPAR